MALPGAAPAHLATFTTTHAVLHVSDQYVLQACIQSQNLADAGADLKTAMQLDGVTSLHHLRSMIPAIQLPPVGTARAAVYAVVTDHLLDQVFPGGVFVVQHVPGPAPPAGAMAGGGPTGK